MYSFRALFSATCILMFLTAWNSTVFSPNIIQMNKVVLLSVNIVNIYKCLWDGAYWALVMNVYIPWRCWFRKPNENYNIYKCYHGRILTRSRENIIPILENISGLFLKNNNNNNYLVFITFYVNLLNRGSTFQIRYIGNYT